MLFQAVNVVLKEGRNFKPIFVKKQKSKLCLAHGKMVISCAFLFIKPSLVIFSDEESYLPYEHTGKNNFLIFFQMIYPKIEWERPDRILSPFYSLSVDTFLYEAF